MSVTVPARPERGNADPSTPPAEAPTPPDTTSPPAEPAPTRARTFAVAYITDHDGLFPPYLVAVDGRAVGGNQFADLLGAAVDDADVGEVEVPHGLTALEVGRAVWDEFGGHVGRFGRPARVEVLDPDLAGRLLGRVAACVWSWPALAAPGRAAGGATAANVAAAVGANVADVADIFARFKLSGPTREQYDEGLTHAVELGLFRRDARGNYNLTKAGNLARDLAWDGVFARVGLALVNWPMPAGDAHRPPLVRQGGRA